MKKLVYAAVLCCLSFAGSAQDGMLSEKSNNLKVSLFSPLVRTFTFFYERKLNESSSFQIGAGFISWSPDDVKLSGFHLTPEYRMYLSNNKAAMEGFYVGPFLRYLQADVKDKEFPEDGGSLKTIGGGVVVGNQWIFRDKISLDLFAGPMYNSRKVTSNDPNEPLDEIDGLGGFGVRVGVTLGIVF